MESPPAPATGTSHGKAMMDRMSASRRYVVTLAHSCDHTPPSTGEVCAHSLTDLLHVLHDIHGNSLACPACGPTGMTVQSITVVLEEHELTERLGEHASELFAPAH